MSVSNSGTSNPPPAPACASPRVSALPRGEQCGGVRAAVGEEKPDQPQHGAAVAQHVEQETVGSVGRGAVEREGEHEPGRESRGAVGGDHLEREEAGERRGRQARERRRRRPPRFDRGGHPRRHAHRPARRRHAGREGKRAGVARHHRQRELVRLGARRQHCAEAGTRQRPPRHLQRRFEPNAHRVRLGGRPWHEFFQQPAERLAGRPLAQHGVDPARALHPLQFDQELDVAVKCSVSRVRGAGPDTRLPTGVGDVHLRVQPRQRVARFRLRFGKRTELEHRVEARQRRGWDLRQCLGARDQRAISATGRQSPKTSGTQERRDNEQPVDPPAERPLRVTGNAQRPELHQFQPVGWFKLHPPQFIRDDRDGARARFGEWFARGSGARR